MAVGAGVAVGMTVDFSVGLDVGGTAVAVGADVAGAGVAVGADVAGAAVAIGVEVSGGSAGSDWPPQATSKTAPKAIMKGQRKKITRRIIAPIPKLPVYLC